jgi:acyl-coenzyme A synthetase/AMP-(fatty) acid ligase
MGHRIELGEIEAAACAVEGIKAAVCLFDDKKNKIIMAYVSDTDDTAGIIRTLQKRLPRYMIPNIMKQLESMPLTSGGKADRQRLKAMFIEG